MVTCYDPILCCGYNGSLISISKFSEYSFIISNFIKYFIFYIYDYTA